MDTISIDNCYEEDGLANLFSALNGLNTETEQNPTDPLRRVLVAILPEFREDGRLDRLNVLTVRAEDPGLLTEDEIHLMDAAYAVVKDLQKARRAQPTPKPPSIEKGSDHA